MSEVLEDDINVAVEALELSMTFQPVTLLFMLGMSSLSSKRRYQKIVDTQQGCLNKPLALGAEAHDRAEWCNQDFVSAFHQEQLNLSDNSNGDEFLAWKTWDFHQRKHLFNCLMALMCDDLTLRGDRRCRIQSFCHHLTACFLLIMATRSSLIRHGNMDRRYTVTIRLLEWQDKRRRPLATPTFSPEQAQVMEAMRQDIDVADVSVAQQASPIT
eukprot:6349515-Karenia_brevis.AAC.1